MPTLLVIWIAKISAWMSRALGRGEASALPGLIAERLQPDILELLGRQLGDGSILITGTNGKTTTTRMAAAVMEANGQKPLVNRGGSNLTRGLVSTLIGACDWQGKVTADLGVFEVDEAAFPAAFRALKPKAIVILNLFRDQLDRYGELNTLADKLKQALRGTNSQVVLNADDPLVTWLGNDLRNVHYFGLESANVSKLDHDFAADSNACPVCGRKLVYDQLFYAHVGIYHCSEKHFARPNPNVVGNTTKATLSESKTSVKAGSARVDLNLELPGLYNVYNALAATTLAKSLGCGLQSSIEAIETVPAAFGRAEIITINGRKVQIFLVKNPTGFNQVIQAYRSEPESKPTLILVNDLIADGRDVSWLWDVAFEDMPTGAPIVSGGTRAYDLALRLKYAKTNSFIELDYSQAIDWLLDQIPKGSGGIILPTYTAMLAIRRELAKRIDMIRIDA